MNWELIWKVLFVGVIAVFAVMSVLVTVLGARDIRELMKHLNAETNDEENTSQDRR